MNLIAEIDKLIKEPMRDEDAHHDRVFWRLVDICAEMAKRIEALEPREDPRGQARGYAYAKFSGEQDIL